MFLQLKEIKYSENILKEKVNGVEIQTQKGRRKLQDTTRVDKNRSNKDENKSITKRRTRKLRHIPLGM